MLSSREHAGIRIVCRIIELRAISYKEILVQCLFSYQMLLKNIYISHNKYLTCGLLPDRYASQHSMGCFLEK